MNTKENKNPHSGHRKRMRERYAQNGFCGWADHEVLEFILFDKIPRRDTNKLAHDILDKFGSIENVLKATPEQLQEIKGIGLKTAKYLCSQEKIYNFCKIRKNTALKQVYDTERSYDYFSALFADNSNEVFYMICLDSRNRILRYDLMFEGSFESINLNVGSMVRIAVKSEACKVVLAHNHPSGVLLPSESDIAATRVIVSAMKLVGVEVMEHVIVTEEGCRDMMKHYPFK